MTAKIKALPKKILAIIAAAAVLVVVVLAAVIVSVAGGSVKPPVLYYADGELQGVMQGQWNKPFEVTKNFGGLLSESYAMMTQYSENGRYMFYMDGGGLYYRDLKKNNAKVDREPKSTAISRGISRLPRTAMYVSISRAASCMNIT